MRFHKKHALFLGAALLAAGLLIMASTFFYIKFDFSELNSTDLSQRDVSVEEPFERISIDVDWFDVRVLPQSGTTAQVLAPEGANLHTEISVRDGTLLIELKDVRRWYQRFFSFAPGNLGTVTVYLPSGTYSALKIATDTGDIKVEGGAADALRFDNTQIETSTGDVHYHADMPKGATFVPEKVPGVLWIVSSTGDVAVSDTDVYVIDIFTTTGDVTLTACSARTIKIESDTGEIALRDLHGDAESGTLHLVTDTSTGDVTVSSTASSMAEITTSTGDVAVSGGSTSYQLLLNTSTGDVTVKDHAVNFVSIKTSSGDVLCDGTSSRRFSVTTSSGDVECPSSAKKGDYCEVKTSSGDITIINTPAN